jgi:23S rRNA pseudouridine2457 synthase
VANTLIFNKPYGVLSQFTDADGHPGLKRFVPTAGVYAVGRLDRDSEGLLVLSDEPGLAARIADPRARVAKTYRVQVEGTIDEAVLARLVAGVRLNDGAARALAARAIPDPMLWPRDPPVRFRKSVPTAWLELAIDEGRNRQVRRMTAAVGRPTLRLVRWSVGPWSLDGLAPGEWREVEVPAELRRRAAATQTAVPRPARAPGPAKVSAPRGRRPPGRGTPPRGRR